MTAERLCLSLLLLTAWSLSAMGQDVPSGTQAETTYLSARDLAIARIKARDERGYTADGDRDARDLRDLALKLRTAIGPVAIKGFGKTGTPNIETLSSGDVGFGALDALVFHETKSTDTTLVVTTRGLFARWLRDHQRWWDQEPPLPQAPAEALAREAVYTQAISSDAAIQLYAPLPVTPLSGSDLAIAHLEAATQDETPPLPDHILAAVMSRDRLFIFQAPLGTPFAPIADCKPRQDGSSARRHDADGPPASTGADDDASFKLRQDAMAAERRCFRARSRTQEAFAAATRQAQRLIALVAAKP